VTVRDIDPAHRRVLNRGAERVRDTNPLTAARRELSTAYNAYFAGIETTDAMVGAERKVAMLLKAHDKQNALPGAA